MAENTLERKHMACVMCEREVYYEVLTNVELGAPEMISGSLSSPGSWFGVIEDKEEGVMLIACCSEACTRAMLIGGIP